MLKKGFAVSLVFFGFLVFLFAEAQEYLVGPGDTIYVMVWGQEELSGTLLVAPDGTIALPTPVGVVEVRGKTVKEIKELLTAQLSEYIKSPHVTVSLREMGYLIHIIGEVQAPSYYKVPENTTLQELITRAGGLTEYANTKRISLTSQNEEGTTVQEIDFSKFLKENKVGANAILKPNDVIFVPRISTEEYLGGIVNVFGSVKDPGTFELEEQRALFDVIALAGGFTLDADLEKVQIVDLRPESYNVQTVNIKGFLNNDPSANPMVRPRTIVYVPSTQLAPELTIPINMVGQVLRPGAYRVVAEKSRLMDAIFTAGGFTEGADIEGLKIIHRNSKSGEKERFNLKIFLVTGDINQNPALQEGDTVFVPISKTTKQISVVDTAFVAYKAVKIMGAVRSPSAYNLPAEATLLDLLILAQGVTPTADLERATLIREAGEKTKFEVNLKRVLAEGRFELLPQLVSGDMVFIPEQKEGKWRQVVRFAGELSTVTMLVWLVTRVVTGRD